MAKFEIETMYHVYDNDHGQKISVGMDADSLGMVEIVGDEYFGGKNSRICIEPEMALKLAEAITRCAHDLKNRKD